MANGREKTATGAEEARKRTRRRESKDPTPQSKAWTLREVGGKTVWDWLQLLIVPIVLSLITVAFTWHQNSRQQELQEHQARVERNIEEQRAQDEALQAYFDQMSTLLLEEDLRDPPADSEVRTLARSRTLSVLGRLDPYRKRSVVSFLHDSRLINRQGQSGTAEEAPVVDLEAADLRGADLSESNLIGGPKSPNEDAASVAVFQHAVTPDLPGNTGVDLSGTNMKYAKLGGTFLPNADLSMTVLSHADLTDANLKNADLTGARLYEADLTGADLTGARGIDVDDLKQQVRSLQSATMPDGRPGESTREATTIQVTEPIDDGAVHHPGDKGFPNR